MSSEKSLQTVFNEALEREDPGERARYLVETCGADAGLREQVEALLRANAEAGSFLSQSAKASNVAPPATPAALPVERTADRIGRYKLLQQIGEGGCGVVYLAEQEAPVRRRVALKVIKLGMDTKQVIARFEAERQALALMDHPNIARVLDAGATESGRPFFVMELVAGVKITAYCDAHKFSTAERLQLFIQVCQAIQHAHQKGVIHRDVKPSNILVTVVDGVAVPKVIDFGIAKATNNQPLTDKTLFTAFEQFIGTPAYMSPEQAELSGVDIDTRTDIYSLGVVLYELLTGKTPFDSEALLRAGIDEIRRTIREQEPPKPSTRLNTLSQAELTTTARARQTDSPVLIHAVQGDLDWTVMKCLQKDRARRYETANELATDLQRHLDHEPVLARPDAPWYRFSRFVRRNRVAVSFVGAIILALAVGLGGTITQARRAAKNAALAETQRNFALRQLGRAEVINDLNSFLLSDAAPVGKPFTVGELLVRAERVLERQTGGSVANRVQALIAIGHQYENQDQHGKARELLSRAYALSRTLPDPGDRAEAAATLSVSVALAGDPARGEALIQEALRSVGESPEYIMHRVFCYLRGSRVAREAGEEALGVERVRTAQRLAQESNRASPLLQLTIEMELAEAYRMAGKNHEAAVAFAAAYQQLVALGRDETEKAGTLLNNWALTLDGMGQPLEAERIFRQAMQISRAEGSNAATVSPMLLNNYARTLFELRRLPEAAEHAELAYQKALAAGDEHVVNMTANVLASIYREQGRLKAAGEMLAKFETKTKEILPPGHFAFAIVATQKALYLLARNEAAAALPEVDRAIALMEAKPELRDRLGNLYLGRAKVLLALGRIADARAEAARALALNQEAFGAATHSSFIGRAYLQLGYALKALGQTAAAGDAFSAASNDLRRSLGAEHPETQAAANALANP